MAYCTASDVRLVIKTALTDAEIEGIIKMSDAEIEQRLGQQTPDDLVRKLSTLITAYTIKTRQPSAVAVGEYREETGDIHQKWETEITRLYRLKTKVTISGSGGDECASQ